MNWIKDNAIVVLTVAVLGALSLAGIQTLRLAWAMETIASNERDYLEKVAKAEKVSRETEAKYRQQESAMQAAREENEREQERLRVAREADRVASAAQLERLRSAITAQLASRTTEVAQSPGQLDEQAGSTGRVFLACAERYADVGARADQLTDQVRGLQAHVSALVCQ